MFQWWTLTCSSIVPPPLAPQRGSRVWWNSRQAHSGIMTTSDAKKGMSAVSAAKVVVRTSVVFVASSARCGGPNPGYYGNLISHRCPPQQPLSWSLQGQPCLVAVPHCRMRLSTHGCTCVSQCQLLLHSHGPRLQTLNALFAISDAEVTHVLR